MVEISGSEKVFQSEIVFLINQILLGPARHRNMYTPSTGIHQIGILEEKQKTFLNQKNFFESEIVFLINQNVRNFKIYKLNKNFISTRRYQ